MQFWNCAAIFVDGHTITYCTSGPLEKVKKSLHRQVLDYLTAETPDPAYGPGDRRRLISLVIRETDALVVGRALDDGVCYLIENPLVARFFVDHGGTDLTNAKVGKSW